jgi:hypothetical protein
MIEQYLPYVTLTGVFVLMFLATKKALYVPAVEDNHTIPHKNALTIAVAQAEGKPAIFHGGCVTCIWRHQNTTHAGIAFCRGCQYFTANWGLPDKSICEYDLEKL